jgi:DNA-binding NarL/FixJ family response regulator
VIRVLIVDDHEVVRAGLSDLLGDTDGILVVGECTDGAEVPAIGPQVQPDVVLMDVQMPRVNGPDATRILLTRQPTVRVLMVSAATSSRIVAEAVAAGASGYVLKGGDPQELIDAVRTVAGGGTAWPGHPATGSTRQTQAPSAGHPPQAHLPVSFRAAT